MDVGTSNEPIAVVTRPTYETTLQVEVSKTRMSTPANGCELVLACFMVHHSSYIHSQWPGMHDKPRIPPGDFECSEIASTSTVNDTICLHARVHVRVALLSSSLSCPSVPYRTHSYLKGLGLNSDQQRMHTPYVSLSTCMLDHRPGSCSNHRSGVSYIRLQASLTSYWLDESTNRVLSLTISGG